MKLGLIAKLFGFSAIGVVLLACDATSDEPAAASSEGAQITDILTMTRRADGQFDVVCANGSRAVVTAAQIAANQVCGNGTVTPPPVTPPPAIVGRIFGRSDSCGGDPVVTVTTATDCFALSGTDIAWSTWQNGRCNDIPDTTVRTACLAMKPTGMAIFGRSDNCTGDAVQVKDDTNCFAMSASDVAWSVFKDGRCVDVSDTNQRAACLELKPSGTAIFGRNDNCGGDAVMITDETDCFALSATDVSWSVWKDGRCVDASDTTMRNACLTVKPTGRVIYGRSDNCSGDPVARITPGFDCFTLSASDVAWSVWVDGQCRDISDTNVRAACLTLEPQ